MATKTRVLRSGYAEITQGYKGSSHSGIDIVKKGYMLDYITAHSDGVVTRVISNVNLNTPKDSSNPGNMVVIDHGNGYTTRYLHLQYGSVKVKPKDKVTKGQILGYMGNTGYSFGGHLHFDVLKNNVKIDPTPYLNTEFPQNKVTHNYKVGDAVTINGVYTSSSSIYKLKPLKNKGTITRIVTGAKNSYLIDNGNIGWTNDACITNSNSTLKSIDVIAKEVIKGLWGNGNERKTRLTAAGYNYNEIQKRVNELLR